MRKLILTRFVASAALAVFTTASLPAQQNVDRLPEMKPGAQSHPAPRGAGYLERRYGLSRGEATRRLELEQEVSEFAMELAQRHSGDFIGSFIEHRPAYRVTLVFSSDIQLPALQIEAPAELRPALRIRRSKYSVAQIHETKTEIHQILAPLGQPYTLSYDFRTDKFVVSVEDESRRISPNLFPAVLRADVLIRRVGRPELMQTGVQPGDEVYGGWTVYNQDNNASCTFGFVVRDSSGRQGITTAAHCPPTTKILYADNRLVTLPAPFANETGTTSGRSYDFRAHHTAGITSGPWVWYWNNRQGTYQYYLGTAGYETRSWANVHPEYDIDGNYFYVTGVITGSSNANYGHPLGAVRCKNGMTTGITCGEVTSSSTDTSTVDQNGNTVYYYSHVEVAYADQMVIAYGGDSGGPVFTEPIWDTALQQYTMRSSGSLVGGNTRPSGIYRRPCVIPDDGYCYFV